MGGQTVSKVLVITASLREKSNSDILAERLIAGAREAGHEVEEISLKGKEILFCTGCLSCQKTQKCVRKDDAVRIAEEVKNADTLVFATPIYYYEMSGQMKTLLDRLNPLYPSDYRFRKVYLLSVAAEDEETTPEKAVNGLQGWVDCFDQAELAGSLFCGGINDPGEVSKKTEALEKAYAFGKALA
jgi:multimeric flavodoxin WrbA